MRFLKSILLAGIIILVFDGCRKDPFSQVVTIEIPKHTPALAITCHLIDGSESINCLVSHSLGIVDQKEYTIIDDATVEIEFEGNLLYDLPYSGSSNLYEYTLGGPLSLKAGTYRLKVSAPDFEGVWAEQVVSESAKIDKTSFEFEGTVSDIGRAHLLKLDFKDLPGKQYYGFNAFLKMENSELQHLYLYSNDFSVENGFSENAMISDGAFSGKSYHASLIIDDLGYNNDFLNDNNKIIVELRTLTADRYYFERSRVIYDDNKDFPFSEPVIVHDNVENGHGIFTVTLMDVQEARIIK